MDEMSNQEAYRILTREWTNTYGEERDNLDAMANLQEVLDQVKRGDRLAAVWNILGIQTERGDKWRAKQDKEFINV